MDVLREILRLSQSPNQEDQAKSLDLYQNFVRDEKTGSFVFESLTNPENFSLVHYLTRCLREWTKLHWSNMPDDMKTNIFVSLKDLILQGSPISRPLAEAFVDIASSPAVSECAQAYEPSLLDTFKSIQTATSVDHVFALITLISFLCRKYQTKKKFEVCEPVLIIQRVADSTFPLLQNTAFLETEEGCQILLMCLSAFKHIFIRCRAGLETAEIPLSFARAVLEHFVSGKPVPHAKLIGSCVKFISDITNTKWTAKKCEEQRQGIAQMMITTLAFTVTNHSDNSYLMAVLLKTVGIFLKYIPDSADLGLLILSAAKLGESDMEEFIGSPAVFYASLYSKSVSGAYHPRAAATGLFWELLNRSMKYAEILLSAGPEEHIMRCIGVCIEGFKEDPLRSALLDWVMKSASQKFNPIEKTAQLYMLSGLVPLLDITTCISIFDGDMTQALNSEFLVLKAMACRLFVRLVKQADISPNEEVIRLLIEFSETCPTTHAGKAVNLIMKIMPEYVLPRADILIGNIMTSLQNTVDVLLQNPDNDDIVEQAENTIEKSLNLLAGFMKSCGKYYTPDSLIMFMNRLLGSDVTDEMSDFYDSVASVCLYIVTSESPKSSDIVRMILNAISSNEVTLGFSSLLEPLIAIVGVNPEGFLSLNISETFIDLCMNIIDKTDGITHVSCLVSFVTFVDPRVADKVWQFVNQLTGIQKEADAVLDFVITEMTAAVFMSKKAVPNTEIIERIQKFEQAGCIRRICHHYLFAEVLCLLAVQTPQLALEALNVVCGLLSRAKELAGKSADEVSRYWSETSIPPTLAMLEIDWPFPSPYEKFNLSELLGLAIQNCPPEAVDGLKATFPLVFQ